MLWMALRWNWGNILPVAAFCLLTIITIGQGIGQGTGQGWSTNPADTSPHPQWRNEPIATSGRPPIDLRQPAATIALSSN
jgi:hypothetical protein